jgi:hypothetical protein
MGLLDEAIREHLELKRRRGADPTAVAREEREALAPVFADEDADPQDHADHGEPPPHDGADGAPSVAEAGTAHVDGGLDGDPRPEVSTMGQDTAELDMQAVMEEAPGADDAQLADPPTVDAATSAAHAAHAREPPDEDVLEWETPGEREREPIPEDVPGQERLSFE